MQILSTEQHEEWMGVLSRTAQHDFYHLPQYHALAESRGEGTAQLYVHQEGDHLIALPLLVRDVGEGDQPNGWKDATSVYGYGGPVASSATVPESVVGKFQDELRQVLATQKIVSVFSRLHPLLAQRDLLAGLGEIRPCGQTVSIDLTLSPETQRAQYSGSYRTRINRLLRNGVNLKFDLDLRYLGEFVEVYHETMRRVNAQSAYFFDEDYFTQLAQKLGSTLRLCVAMEGDTLIAGSLFTLHDGIVQYHLGATRDAFLKLSPMVAILDTARAWGTEEGARVLHLGGGVGSKEDSLFNFKAGFSDRRHSFETWRWVIVPSVYEHLSREHSDRLDGSVLSDYFPAYRCPGVPCLAVN